MNTKPSDGERRAASGYRPQYLVGASLILKALDQGDLEWIRVADPEAGRVDDIQIATTGRVDAYQVKWSQYGGTVTWRNLTQSTNEEPALFKQLAHGWEKLRETHPNRRVVVHLATNRIPAYTSSGMPDISKRPPQPYHLSAFVEQAWLPALNKGKIESKDEWKPVWKALQDTSELSNEVFIAFIQDCRLNFQLQRPSESTEIKAICDLLFATAASAERIIQLNRDELLARLGWTQRYRFHNLHEFPAPRYLYRPIQTTLKNLLEKLETQKGGYLGVFGPPGSGKSTFLTRVLRALPVRLVRYYAYVPDAQDPSVLRGESINFFHDVTLRLWQAGFSKGRQPDPSDRVALINRFHEQLQSLGEDYRQSGIKTILLIDGLDHIEREQHPTRSLLTDLPLPNTIPIGVYIIIGSQTIELPNLPVQVRHVLSQSDHSITMARLAPSDVYAIVQDALPRVEQDHYQKIFQLSDGHPLALIYLLNTLDRVDTPQGRKNTLEDSLPYKGDIEAQYFAHWSKIENDENLTRLLGLLARIRGPIPMNWVAQWANPSTLRKLQRLFMQYFSSDSQDRWEFFHNSFRLFLEAKTAEPLPGQSGEQVNQQYHLELADHYRNSVEPWQWETLYHYFQAEQFQNVINLAQYNWFKTQVESLRPIDAIETDVRLAIKAAGELTDPAALIRYTLIGASLQQRGKALDDTSLPHLLIDTGEFHLAADYARDGARLRISEEAALALSIRLYDAGLEQDALRIFELAEPLEYLSGRPILDDNTRPQNLEDLLGTWVESVSHFRSLAEVIQIVRRIQIDPTWHDDKKDRQGVSHELQNWLIYKGALACCERKNWAGWQIFFDALDEKKDHTTRFFILLRSAERLYEAGQIEATHQLLKDLNTMEPPESVGDGRQRLANCLSIAELYYFQGGKEALVAARLWLDKVKSVPLTDKEISNENTPKLYHLQYRYGRLRFLLDPSLSPRQMLDAAEKTTRYGPNEEDETKLARRQLHFMALTLAKLWADGYLGYQVNSVAFLHETKWILDLLETGWSPYSPGFGLEVSGVKPAVAKFIVACAAKHGQDVLTATKHEFDARWEKQPDKWWVGTQREIVMTFAQHNVEKSWLKHHLLNIESRMLSGVDLFGRVEECQKQAKAWLQIGEEETALSSLKLLVKGARGIYHDEDYQLARWAKWLRKTNQVEPLLSTERLRTFIRCVASVEGDVSGVNEALQIAVQMLFDLSPRRSIVLFQRLMERKTITHEDGVSHLLTAALEAKEPPVQEAFWIIVELLLPLVRSSSPTLVELLIVQTNKVRGKSQAIQFCQQMIHAIRVDVLSDQRSNWFKGIYDGLIAIGIEPIQLGLEPSDLEASDYSRDDTSGSGSFLYLQSGERLTLQKVTDAIHTVDDLQWYLAQEDRKKTDYFKWHRVTEHLISLISSPEQLWKIEALIESRIDKFSHDTRLANVLAVLSKRFYDLGHLADAEKAIEKALALTKPSGWALNWDGKTKYAVMCQMLSVFGEAARERLIKLYSQDLSQHFWNPEQILIYGGDVAEILFADIPYATIWPDIEIYLEELFAGAVVQPQPKLEATLDMPLQQSSIDLPHEALADLLLLYLDFPAFPVSDRAISACSGALLAGSIAVQSGLKSALNNHDQLTKQTLAILDAVSLLDPQIINQFQDQVQTLRLSANFVIRYTANEIYNRFTQETTYPPRGESNVSGVYKIHLPEIVLHKTDDAIRKTSKPILMGDPALVLRPLDIEARMLAEIAGVVDTNVLYRATQIFPELNLQRTWFPNDSTFETDDLARFLDKVDLRFEHNRLEISPARNTIAHVAAELYDAGYVQVEDWALIASIFRNYDPHFYFLKPALRPSCIERIGGLDYSHERHVRVPNGWIDSSEESLSQLSKRSPDGRVILGEWTKLKRLEEGWPSEERMSLIRATRPSEFWSGFGPDSEGNPFAWVKGAYITDYWDLTEFLPSELIIAHNGYKFQTPGANWLGFNPRIGYEMNWYPSDKGWFRWVDKQNRIVVESIWWQDGPLNLSSLYDHVEVGNGWLVVITDEGFEQLRLQLKALARGGVTKRSLGWLGSKGNNTAISQLDIP